MLKGKVALITGATSGMGRAHLEKLVSNGAAPFSMVILGKSQ